MSKAITLRPASESDEQFLFALYASSRAREVSVFGWDTVQQDAFMRMQFEHRQRAYYFRYPTAESSIVEFAGSPAGRLLVARLADRVVLVDIAILPEFRLRGIAKFLLSTLQADCARSGMSIALCVDKANENARWLYERCGFSVVAEDQVLYSMEWRSPLP